MAKIKMCETGCGERASFRSHKGYDLCRTCYVERRVGEVEPEVQAYRARQPNPAALPTREEVEAVLPEGFRAPGGFYRYSQGHMFDITTPRMLFRAIVPFGSEHRALDIIRERVAEVTGDRREPEKADDAAKNSCDRVIDRKRDTEPAPPPDPYAEHRKMLAAAKIERWPSALRGSDLDERIAAARVDEPGRAPWDWDAEDSEELW